MSPVVDPVMLGTWHGKQHIFHPVRFEISALGVFKVSRDFAEGTNVPSVYVGEAHAGKWKLTSVDGHRQTGTYRLRKDGSLGIHGDFEVPSMQLVERPAAASVCGLTANEFDTVSKLLTRLNSEDANCRAVAALRLAVLAKEHPVAVTPAVPRLIELLEDPSPDARSHAALALANIGEVPASAASSLVGLVGDRDPRPRHSAVKGLRRIVRDQAIVVATLARALSDPHVDVRDAAANELGQMGKEAAPAAQALAIAMAGEESWRGTPALWALKKLPREAASGAAAVLARTLKETRSRDAKQSAVEALTWLGPAAKDAVPTLVEIVRDPDSERVKRVSAAKVLGAIGHDASSALEALDAVATNASERTNLRDAARRAAEEIRQEKR